MPRTYLKVPFQQKDAAKSLGARWFVPENIDTVPFTAWLSGSLRAVATAPPSATALTTSAPGTALAVLQKGVPLSQLLAGVASAVAATYRGGVWTTVEVTEVKARRHVIERQLPAALQAPGRPLSRVEPPNSREPGVAGVSLYAVQDLDGSRRESMRWGGA